MLTELRIKNARNFKGKLYRFPLGPLNAITGENSSGKSSILKSLLLLKQSFSIGPRTLSNPMLRFGGPLVDLGDYETFIAGNKKENELSLGLTSKGVWPTSFYKLKKGSGLKWERFTRILDGASSEGKIPYEFHVDFTFNHSDIVKKDLSANRARTLGLTSGGIGKGVLVKSNFKILVSNQKIFECKVKLAKRRNYGEDFIISIPKNSGEIGLAKMLLSKSDEDSRDFNFRVSLNKLVPYLLVYPRYLTSEQEIRYAGIPSLLRRAIYDLEIDLQNIKYLGPLRSQGQRYYILDPDPISEDDPVGQFLPNILRDYSKRKVIYSPPNKYGLKQSVSLQKALNEWLSYLKIGARENSLTKAEYSTTYHARVLAQISLRGADGKPHSLLDSGFGFSQVLPILVDLLRAPPGSTYIVEQPELHLHPAIQVRLAEFFMAMSCLGKKIIFETHSEHMINTIRALVAEQHPVFESNDINLYYIDTYRKKPKILNLGIDSEGNLTNWPKSFFGEGVELSLRILNAQSKR